MVVYRITSLKWAGQLGASGFPARWNSRGVFTIYTASSRALACLENVVHRSGEGLSENFKVMEILIPDHLAMDSIVTNSLRDGWTDYVNMPQTQAIGGSWSQKNVSLILEVPSAIVPNESNFLINPAHPHFNQIQTISTSDFIFDNRLKK